MTVAGHVNINQEGAGNQVKDDAQATPKTEVSLASSSISSVYAAKFLNFDNIPSADTKAISMLDINVQHEVPQGISTIKSEVPNGIKSTLDQVWTMLCRRKYDEEMTVAGHVNINQEGTGNQVKDDAQATQKTEVSLASSSISSVYAAKFLNFDNIPSADTEAISMLDINVQHEVPRTSSLLTIPVSVIP
nr:hypothetical protein [Tanacetum cinerariifolium]